MKIDIYPEKAQYLTKEPIKLIIEAEDIVSEEKHVVLHITNLEKTVYHIEIVIHQGMNEITLEGIDTEFGGYGVILSIKLDNRMVCAGYTSFDVVSNCSRSIRYGFLSDFKTEDGENSNDISNLRKFHINMVQYYDWSYRHDDLVAKEQNYQDMMGKVVDLGTVKRKIRDGHTYGMKSIGYGAVYAASEHFYSQHKECALYTSAGDPLVFIDTFYIMNVASDSYWRKHIIEEYAKAVSGVGFDGIHMDTYGFPKTAYSYSMEKLIRLEEEYPSLIEDTKKRLNELTSDNYLIFNNVGNWPVGPVAGTAQDAMYIEVWKPYVSYYHIKQIILDAKRECKNQKPTILAAYLEPFRTDTMERAANAAYLLTAAITVNGAYHLLLGEENAVLTQGYYVDHTIIDAQVSNKLRSYYDFIIQYMELFYDSELVDVSMTHIGWDNTEYRCLSPKWSVTCEANHIWLTIREKENRKLISFINLCGNPDNEWNLGKNHPEVQSEIGFQVQIDKPVEGLYLISPDYDHGTVQELTYETVKTDRGWSIEFMVPDLSIWSNVWIDFKTYYLNGYENDYWKCKLRTKPKIGRNIS